MVCRVKVPVSADLGQTLAPNTTTLHLIYSLLAIPDLHTPLSLMESAYYTHELRENSEQSPLKHF